MSAITSLSARQLRRAAEIKEEIQSLEYRLNRLTDSPDAAGIHIVPKRRERLRARVKAGMIATVGQRWTRAAERSLVAPARRLKHQLGSAARAKIAAAARARLERARNIEVT
ncbi:MAG TPA: hypothetical protein VH280_15035 [Verrucomicrobiae bacterium]|nr:hypothetical protein [Verrucomicrobiae bacterium]